MDLDGYPFSDLTGSGMTNTGRSWSSVTNSFRVGESHPIQNVGLIEIDWAERSLDLDD